MKANTQAPRACSGPTPRLAAAPLGHTATTAAWTFFFCPVGGFQETSLSPPTNPNLEKHLRAITSEVREDRTH